MVNGWGRENRWEKLGGGRWLGVGFFGDGFWGARFVFFFLESLRRGRRALVFSNGMVADRFREKNKSKKMGAAAALEKMKASGLLGFFFFTVPHLVYFLRLPASQFFSPPFFHCNLVFIIKMLLGFRLVPQLFFVVNSDFFYIF